CGIPSTSLQGYHTAPRGQSQITHAPDRRGLPPGCRVVGLHQIDGMPHRSQYARSSVMPTAR
ncbi:MAG: hypothetical protein WAU83_24620, partial [Pseudonocardiaceae bacterium]